MALLTLAFYLWHDGKRYTTLVGFLLMQTALDTYLLLVLI